MRGKLLYKIEQGGGVIDGDTVPVISSWSPKAMDCTYQANTISNKGRYDGGAFITSSYSILIDEMDFSAKMVRLINTRGDLICEKVIQSIEVLEEVQKVKITI